MCSPKDFIKTMNHPILTAHYRRIGAKGGSSRSPAKLAALARSRARLAAKRAAAGPATVTTATTPATPAALDTTTDNT